jgi:hypothetical protein
VSVLRFQKETGASQRCASSTAGPLRYVGKETDRRWTEGEDVSLLTFKQIEYLPSAKVVADGKSMNEISKRGLRELMRLTGLSQHTIEAIRNDKAVRASTLALLKKRLPSFYFTSCHGDFPQKGFKSA